MKTLTLPLIALVAALAGAGIAVGVMVWEPWEGNRESLSLPARLALCDSNIRSDARDQASINSPFLRDQCYDAARGNLNVWQCYIAYGSSFDEARRACLTEVARAP